MPAPVFAHSSQSSSIYKRHCRESGEQSSGSVALRNFTRYLRTVRMYIVHSASATVWVCLVNDNEYSTLRQNGGTEEMMPPESRYLRWARKTAVTYDIANCEHALENRAREFGWSVSHSTNVDAYPRRGKPLCHYKEANEIWGIQYKTLSIHCQKARSSGGCHPESRNLSENQCPTCEGTISLHSGDNMEL